jgi:hypothetical protein
MASDGIYDVSASTNAPTLKLAFATNDTTSGYGQYQAYTTIGEKFICYCDETNGYYTYTESTDTWARVTNVQVTGVDPNDLVSVCVHKARLWFVEKDSPYAWYLPSGVVLGAATKFNFGSRFKVGGNLVNLYSWTVDGGSGMDDYLVAVSTAGDVVVFRGNDPDTATDWFQHGAWDIGLPPAGRRIGGSFGGEPPPTVCAK